MSETELWELRSPRGREAARRRDCVPRLKELKGARIGLVDNGFPNAAIALNKIRQRLLDRFELSEVVDYRRRRSVGYFDPRELLDEFASKCDAVVLGIGT